MTKVVIDIDDKVNSKPPYHTRFIIVSGFTHLKPIIQKQVIKVLQESVV